MICLCFNDATNAIAFAAFGGPQDIELYPYQEMVDENDARYLEFLDPALRPPTQEQVLANNQAQQVTLMTQAFQSMTPVFLSLQLGDATDAETVSAKAWRAYYQALHAVDLTVTAPAWPDAPQS